MQDESSIVLSYLIESLQYQKRQVFWVCIVQQLLTSYCVFISLPSFQVSTDIPLCIQPSVVFFNIQHLALDNSI